MLVNVEKAFRYYRDKCVSDTYVCSQGTKLSYRNRRYYTHKNRKKENTTTVFEFRVSPLLIECHSPERGTSQ